MAHRFVLLCGTLAGAIYIAQQAAGEPAANAPRLTVELQAGDVDRQATPVHVELPDALRSISAFRLDRLPDGKPTAVQVAHGDRPTAVWIVEDLLRAGESRRYRLAPDTAPPDGKDNATCHNDGKRLTVRIARRPVLTYNQDEVSSPPGIPALYRRSGYIHPLLTPSGVQVTDDFPPDHAHQHAVFFAWVKSRFHGRAIDFWNQAAKQGRVTHAKTERTASGPVFAEFVAHLQHVDETDADAPQPVLDETWAVRVYNLRSHFLIDLTSRQQCATARPLLVEKNHYGGLAIRGNRAWFSDTGRFLTSEGKDRSNGNQTRPRWVEMYGPVDGKPCGVAVLCHPSNYRYPQPVRLHPTKPYFCFAPMALGKFPIEPGTPYVSQYRFFVHDGPADATVTDRIFQDYAVPPKVRIVE
jgi:hypothetical protein